MKSFYPGNGYKIIRVDPGFARVYLILTGNNAVLIDTGAKRRLPGIISSINSLRKNLKLEYLVLTHTHFDHCQNLSNLKNILDPYIIVGEPEANYIHNGLSPLPVGTNSWSKLIVRLGKSLNDDFFSYQPAQADITINNPYNLPGTDIDIIPTPGHSPGSVSIIINKEFALVGDSLFGISPFTIFPLFATDEEQLLKSWKILIDTGCHTFIPAHGRIISIDRLKKEFEKHSARLRIKN